MDLSLVTVAQQQAVNQFTFDQEVLDQKIRRAEHRRDHLRQAWAASCAGLRIVLERVHLATAIASPRRQG